MATTTTTDEILERTMLDAVEHAGETSPTGDQLKRWRRAGLLPRPRLEHRPGIRGSRSWYPAWAADQLLAILRLHRSTHKLMELCTALWWEGHWVDPLALREALTTPLEHFSNEALAARAGVEDPYEAADAILNAMTDNGKPSEIVKLLRTRLSGPGDLANFMWTLLVIALGGKAPWDQEDRSRPDPAPTALQLLTNAVGMNRAMSEKLGGRPPWLPSDFDPRPFIAELRDAGGFALEDAARPIREATDEALSRAREDAWLFVRPLAMIVTVLEALLGEDVAGLGSLRAMAPTTAFERASLIRSMLILRQLAGDEAFREIEALVDSAPQQFAIGLRTE
jgi:hypothetical protein